MARTNASPERAFKVLTIVGCLGTLGFLLAEMRREHFAGEWREHQAAYAASLDPELAAAFEPALRQAFLPELGRVDRCQSCHVAVDDPRMAGAEQPLKAHPGTLLASHPPENFGCTVCHQGQGRAVTLPDAHGAVAHWEEPLLRGQFVYTTCGECHSEHALFGFEREHVTGDPGGTEVFAGELAAALPGAAILDRGKQLVASSGCLGCHEYRGRGGTLGPELTHVGDKGVHGYDFSHLPPGVERTPLAWLEAHFMDPGAVSPGTVMPGVGTSEGDAEALAAYMLALRTQEVPARYRPAPRRVGGGSDRVLTGQELYELYCVACHGRDLAGSDVPEIRTPSLSNADFLSIADAEYLRHLITHGRSGTNMPAWRPDAGGLSAEQIDRVVQYILSFAPDAVRPEEIVLAEGEARFGRALFRGNCAACHGLTGEGGLGTRLNSPDFLAMASDEFLVRTLLDGRPGTGMPSWRDLSAQDVADVLAFVRAWGEAGADPAAVLEYVASGHADAAIGARIFRARCADCHGRSGEGGVGPSLNTPELLTRVDDAYLVYAIRRGRPGTAMPAWRELTVEDIGDLVAHLRTLCDAPPAPPPARIAQGDPETGQLLYQRACASCHGAQAVGGVGPQLRNPELLAHASDGLLYETIAYGRVGTAMRGFLKGGLHDGVRSPWTAGVAEFSPAQVADVVAWLRSLEHAGPADASRVAVLGSASRGRELYQGLAGCVSCHGAAGEGGVGPALANATFLEHAPEGFLIGTMVLGRAGTEMRRFSAGGIAELSTEQFMDVAAYVRSLGHGARAGPDTWRPFGVTEDRVELGGELYERYCVSCHGIEGRGGYAPELNNPEFLAAASDGYLAATIARGRKGTPMRAFGLGPSSLADLDHEALRAIVGYLRSWQALAANEDEHGEPEVPQAQ